LYELRPEAVIEFVENEIDQKENDISSKMFEMLLILDGKEFRAKETSKAKAKAKICKQAVRYLQPNIKHYFF